jgi:HEAT repeat protein
VGTDTKALLEFLRNRAPEEASEERLEQLIRQLGDDRLQVREGATEQLVRLGNLARARLQKAAATDSDAEVVMRSRVCLERIDRDLGVALPQAAVRVLVKRRAAEAVAVLLQYLPVAPDEANEEEIVYGLDALALQNGRVHPALLEALQDKAAARRAAAACIIGHCEDETGRVAVRKLLADKAPLVRLRAAQGLLAAKEKERVALPVLIALLDEPAVEISWQAEELLHWVAGDTAPEAVVGAATDEERRRCRTAWGEWQRTEAEKIDLARLEAEPRRPGLLLLCAAVPGVSDPWPGEGGVWLRGCDGKPRWRLKGSQNGDVQLLPGNRVLLSESALSVNFGHLDHCE